MSDYSSGKAIATAESPKSSSHRPKSSKFRFKSRKRTHSPSNDLAAHPHRKRSHRLDKEPSHGSERSPSPRRRHRHHHHHRHKSKNYPDSSPYSHLKHSPSPSSEYRAHVADSLSNDDSLPPDAAFRESLFDALADDEGAAYWESFYGQPIHVYGRPGQGDHNSRDSRGAQGGQGELEAMTDEEYASYVRARMYERTHQHILEERARQEEARRARRGEEKRARASHSHHADDAFSARVDESLRRGQERKDRAKWRDAWAGYQAGWDKIKGAAGAEQEERVSLPWPVQSGKMKHVSPDNVKAFMEHAPHGMAQIALLKTERVRWHPDKAQQRFGGRLNEEALKAVTAVFQILDQMWNELKKSD
ncbi:hypothetical protein EJ05DRAFT_534857 [Pseudovirgaria hyperparasitica]|uniref:J domain-containing protein n=1 Tax=Pseudovirgaria hyperparasitica TaxID=470096 RepID=A0A6A6WMT3_9PEZI|nr:uncharacterized protein EJ05DRAFT_534857 [Pseudovirgaria hyperparasitica]KAF2763531.1 hypothetical protein EJ05DRAFT_534857 [Pseudovirgaria hyperparasitica]